MPNSDKDDRQRGYVRKHYEKRKEAGMVKCSFWLEPAAAEALEYLLQSEPNMTKGEVINRALRYTEKKTRESESVLEDLKRGTAEVPAP